MNGAFSILRDAGRVMGPAFLVSVAYLDPGNWATAIEAGSRFGYTLVWVVVVSNLVAILLQTLSARLGICTGKHLAQVCREGYPPAVIWILWFTCEVSIVALDLTMLLGTAVGLNLLMGWPLLPCILLTSLDVVLLLLLVPHQGAIKKSEALTVGLLVVVVACFMVDLVVSKPPVGAVLGGLKPVLRREHLYTAVSLLGANVMPHSFYLHSALVSGQARGAAGGVSKNHAQLARLCFLNFCDIGCALAVALVVNVSVLLVSAATFHTQGITVETLQDAHDVMERTLSSSVAPRAFGMALLCAGQLSTFTGTISGQVVLQGFLNVHISTWARRLITRAAAIIPAAVLQYMWGDRATYKFLLIAQVALALQLPVTLVPLIKATSSGAWMGKFRSSFALAAAAWVALGLIFCANLTLLISQMVTGVEEQQPLLSTSPEPGIALPPATSTSGWGLGLGLLQPEGPLDAFLDGVLALAVHSPLRFAVLLGLVVAGASFLALQLWMIVTPLPGPAPLFVPAQWAVCEVEELEEEGEEEGDETTALRRQASHMSVGGKGGGAGPANGDVLLPEASVGGRRSGHFGAWGTKGGDADLGKANSRRDHREGSWYQGGAPGSGRTPVMVQQAFEEEQMLREVLVGASQGLGLGAKHTSGAGGAVSAPEGLQQHRHSTAGTGGGVEVAAHHVVGTGHRGANVARGGLGSAALDAKAGSQGVELVSRAGSGALDHTPASNTMKHQSGGSAHTASGVGGAVHVATGGGGGGGSEAGGNRTGLSRGARKQLALHLDEWFARFYNSHGEFVGRGPRTSPLLCHHTHMAHLCTACAQNLYLEVAQCVAALEALEGAASALLPDARGQPLLPPGSLTLAPPPAAMPALGWHEAAVACVRAGDLGRLAQIAEGLFSGQLDDSRILANMPLALTVGPPTPQTAGRSDGAAAAAPKGQGGVGAADVGEDAGCLPVLLGAAGTGGLLGARQGPAPERPPMMNQWCLLGPASFVSFGLWSFSMLLQLCTSEVRPELWGKYAAVLNKHQGLMRDARLEVAVNPTFSNSGSLASGSSGSLHPSSVSLSSPSSFMSLPGTAAQLQGAHLAALRLELVRQLQVLEIALGDRRGPPGTAAGDVAFPKGKEIMTSVIKRLRRRLGYR